MALTGSQLGTLYAVHYGLCKIKHPIGTTYVLGVQSTYEKKKKEKKRKTNKQ